MNQAQSARFNATWRAFEAVLDPAVMIDGVRIVRYRSFHVTNPEVFLDMGRLP
jgi:hypothetical protein